MAIFALADPHLSTLVGKPMDIFGVDWREHDRKIESAWKQTVGEGDTVILPGDISWAMALSDVVPDLRFLHELPGKKIINKGNHDYWWGTAEKLERLVNECGFSSLFFLKNNAVVAEDAVICGTRGWLLPNDADFREKDRKIFDRERGRLLCSLQKGKELMSADVNRMIVSLHYPPLCHSSDETGFTRLLEDFSADICVYGHIHAGGRSKAFEGERNGVKYFLVSADHIAFTPVRI